ncbi:MAG: hypothetical protein MJ252_28010 [archaeon]|nr:hypothetical protein [archaeon]
MDHNESRVYIIILIYFRDNYYLNEPTWGAGQCSDDLVFERKFQPYYFCVPPEEFIRQHFPKDPKYQLLGSPVSQEEYVNMLKFDATFYNLGFLAVTPDETIRYAENGTTNFRLYFDRDEIDPNFSIHCKLYHFPKSQNPEEIPNCFSVVRYNQHSLFNVDVVTNEPGEYHVVIAGKKSDMKEFDTLIEAKILCQSAPSTPIVFPKTYDVKDLGLIAPKTDDITKGDTVTFQARSNYYKELYLHNNNCFFPMDKTTNDSGDTTFYAQEQTVLGKTADIAIPDGKNAQGNLSFKILATYNVKDNPSVQQNAPKTFGAPFAFNLVRPVASPIQSGQQCLFAVKADPGLDLKIIDGDETYPLPYNEEQAHYIAQVPINGSEGRVKLSYPAGNGSANFASYDVV